MFCRPNHHKIFLCYFQLWKQAWTNFWWRRNFKEMTEANVCGVFLVFLSFMLRKDTLETASVSILRTCSEFSTDEQAGFRQMSFFPAFLQMCGISQEPVGNESWAFTEYRSIPALSTEIRANQQRVESLPLCQSHRNCGGHSIQRWLDSDH